MAQFEKGNTIGNRFNSDNQPKKNGRKPALYKQLKELTGKKVDFELSKEDYFKIIRFLMEQSKPRLEAILYETKTNPNTTTPIWVCTIISAIFADAKYGRTYTIDSLFDRIFGKATLPIEADVTNKEVKEVLTEDQIKAELDRISSALK